MPYTEEIKTHIIARYKSKEDIISISKETGIPRSTIYRGINDYTTKNSISPNIKDKEIKELERKVEKLQTMLVIIHELGISVNAPSFIPNPRNTASGAREMTPVSKFSKQSPDVQPPTAVVIYYCLRN